jgi:4-amino-4-deoxy-L-arabinose transferase-like glycosyltransferase
LATRLTNGPVAAVCTLFYAGDRLILRTSYSGMTESLATFFLLTILLFLFRAKPRIVTWVASGLLCGLAYLARTQLLILLPLTVIYAWLSVPRAHRAKSTALILIPAFLTAAPWLIRNQGLTGNPTFSFSSTRGMVIGALDEASDIDMNIHAPVAADEIRSRYGQAIRKKFVENLTSNGLSLSYWDDTFNMQWPFLLIFVIGLAIPSPIKSREWAVFKSITLVLLMLNLLMVSLTLSDRRFFTMFRPLIILIAVYTVANLISKLSERYRGTLAAMIVILIAAVGIYDFTSQLVFYRGLNDSLDHRKSYEALTELSSPTDIFASDGSRHISFVSDRRAVRLPGDPEQLIELHDKFLNFDYVLLTTRVLRDRTSDMHRSRGFESFTSYRDFIKTPKFRRRFDFVTRLPNNAMLFKKR